MLSTARIRARACVVLALGIPLLVAHPPAALASRATEPPGQPPPSPFGMWRTQDGNGVIAIEPCGDEICGRIIGIVRARGEPIPKDVHGASQCGLTIITHEKPTGDGYWLGNVTDPRTGTQYGAKIWLDDRGNLCLRGFLGLPLLGQTETWHPFTGHVTPTCDVT
jgi:uncharacterized protein (DUF2147 family)